jgi:2-iminobutanoate/2-iminopropanoate deaminase
MTTTVNPGVNIGISSQIGNYSDAIKAPPNAQWLFTSGTPGLAPDGTLPPTFDLQAEQAWKNISQMLERAGMGVEHLVKIVQYLVRPEDLSAYGDIRARFLGPCRPTSVLLVVAALPKPGFLIEIEAFAAAPQEHSVPT